MSPVLFSCFAILATLGHGYLWIDSVNQLHAWPGPRKLVDLATLFCLLAFLWLPLVVLASWSELDLGSLNRLYPTDFWVRCYFSLCIVYGSFKLIINSVNWLSTNKPQTLLHWRQEPLDVTEQLSNHQFTGTVAKLLAKVPGNQVFQLTVDHKRLAIPRLSANHVGLKIAHISDLHMTGRIGPQWYEAVAEEVNRLQADAIAITGDILEQKTCWPWLADSLGKLRAPLGVYFIMGNHDFYVNSAHTKKLLQDQGLICLSGSCLSTEWNNAPVLLAGNERPWSPQVADMISTEQKNSEQVPLRLLLMHTPDQFAWACDQQADLALAGHTHGGQLRFPVLGPVACPSRFGTRYACGVFQRGETVMHVTRGISGKTPLRWRCPPEIALLELVRA